MIVTNEWLQNITATPKANRFGGLRHRGPSFEKFALCPPLAAEVLSLLLVALLWGATNPFLKKGAEGIENVRGGRMVFQLIAEVKFLFINIRVSIEHSAGDESAYSISASI